MNTKRNLLRNLIILIILALVAIGGFIGISLIEKAQTEKIEEQIKKDTEELEYYTYNGINYVQDDNKQIILCVGLDSYENAINDSYRNDELADCIVLLVLDKTNKTVLPIQINRDTMTSYHILGIGGRITNDEVGQIALSHSYGSGGIDSLVNTKDAVEELMCDVDIDYYMSLTMDAVTKINDKAGGVKVLVEDDFSSIDPTLIQGEEVTLLGQHALTFVRSRSGLDDPSNINRLNRQRVYLRGLYDTCKAKVDTDQDFVRSCLDSISEYIISNTNVYGLSDIGNTLLDYELLDAIQIQGEAKKGETYVEFYPDDTSLKELCINLFYKQAR